MLQARIEILRHEIKRHHAHREPITIRWLLNVHHTQGLWNKQSPILGTVMRQLCISRLFECIHENMLVKSPHFSTPHDENVVPALLQLSLYRQILQGTLTKSATGKRVTPSSWNFELWPNKPLWKPHYGLLQTQRKTRWSTHNTAAVHLKFGGVAVQDAPARN